MTSKTNELKDKIFELEIEQKELKIQLETHYDCVEYLCSLGAYDAVKEVEQQVEESQCWIEFYKEELKDIENREKHGE